MIIPFLSLLVLFTIFLCLRVPIDCMGCYYQGENMSLPQTSYCLTLATNPQTAEYCFIRNQNEVNLVTFECFQDIQVYAQRILEISNLSIAFEQVNLTALTEACRQRGISVSFVPKGCVENVPLPEELAPKSEYIGLVYSLVAKESINLLLEQLQEKFGIVLAGNDSGKAQLISLFCGVCLDIAVQKDEPIARCVIKSIIRSVSAAMTDDILNWFVNRLIVNRQEALASVVASAGTKVILKMFRAIALEIYIDQTIDRLNARYGWNL